MSYQALARKWRPKDFTQLVGQDHVRRALVNSLESQKLHHAYLFTGTRGVGKTTIARILAKSLNCERGISATPCNSCTTCLQIDSNSFVDLIEVDAASRTKVEDTREILDNVQYAPSSGRFKVYLIDEVHMLSTSSFNALLKTLEEPPAHVKFLLATTDPQKLPATVLSRCLQFNLLRMELPAISAHLGHILQSENIEYEDGALNLLSRSADGSMRDALSLLDQALAFGGGALKLQDTRDMLGAVNSDALFDLIRHLSANDSAALFALVNQLAAGNIHFEHLINELLLFLHQLALVKRAPSAVDAHLYEPDALQQLAATLSDEQIQLYYQIALLGKRDMALAYNLKSGMEMTLLRMLAFCPAPSGDSAPKKS